MKEEEYQQLISASTELDIEILEQKKYKSWEYFHNLGIPINNLEKNMQANIRIYFSDVFAIHGTKMINIGYFNGRSEIFFDRDFCLNPNNQHIFSCQLIHELLHSLSRLVINGEHNCMRHTDNTYRAIGEAIIQMFAESIEEIELSDTEDYLYFIKNIMRIIKVVASEQKVALQYLNNDTSLEMELIRLTGNPNFFETFATDMQKCYTLSKAKTYQQNFNDKEALTTANNNVLSHIRLLINAKQKENSNILQEILFEFSSKSSEFLSHLDINISENSKGR